MQISFNVVWKLGLQGYMELKWRECRNNADLLTPQEKAKAIHSGGTRDDSAIDYRPLDDLGNRNAAGCNLQTYANFAPLMVRRRGYGKSSAFENRLCRRMQTLRC